MSDLELQAARDFILRAAAKFSRGLTRTYLEISIASVGIELDPTGVNSLDAQIHYLINAGLLASKSKAHTPSMELYVLTTAGDDYLRQNKLL